MTKEQLALFMAKIEEKNSWGKNELKMLLGILTGTTSCQKSE